MLNSFYNSIKDPLIDARRKMGLADRLYPPIPQASKGFHKNRGMYPQNGNPSKNFGKTMRDCKHSFPDAFDK